MGARATRKRGGGVRLFRAEDGRQRRRSIEEEEEGAGKVVEAHMTLARSVPLGPNQRGEARPIVGVEALQ
jgi:hypothetical protein